MAFIQIKSPKGTFFFTGATPQSAFQAFQKKVGGGGSFKNISQQAFSSGLAKFGFSSSGQPISKSVAKPKAKVVSKGPTARQKAAALINAKARAKQAAIDKQAKAFESEFRQFRTGLEPLDVLRKRLGLELGIPGLQAQLEPLQQRALRLGQLQLDLPETVGALTRGQGEARRKLLETSKGADLARQLRDVAISQEFFAGQLTGARGELTEQLGVTAEQRDFDLRAFGQQADLLNTRLAREVKGYTTQLQREFESIIGDITRAEQLTDAKVQRAFELAKLEKAANLEAGNIRLRGGIQAAATAKTTAAETAKNKVLGKASAALTAASGNSDTLKSVLQAQINANPQFSKDLIDIANSLGGQFGPSSSSSGDILTEFLNKFK